MPAAAPSHPRPVAGTAPSWAGAAHGAWLWDASGRSHADFACAGGSVLLGHADPDVERAAASPCAGDGAEAAGRIGAALAEPQAVWTQGAASAQAAAEALARRATGRTTVLKDEVAETLAAQLATGDVAAVVVDPDAGRRPSAAVLRAIVAAGTLLIVDETGGGLRRGPAGAGAALGLRADLTVWGAGLANGRALGAVTGEAALLRHAPVVSPPGAECLAAAAATLRKLEREGVALHIAVRGAEVQAELERLVADAGLAGRLRVGGDPSAVTLVGLGPGARGLERRLAAQLAARGVHAPGPLSLSFAHDDAEIEALLDAASAALPLLAGAAHVQGQGQGQAHGQAQGRARAA